MDGNAQPVTGLEGLKQHVKANRIDVALWCTRGLTLAFLFFYIIPIFGNPYNTYYKALAASAATSALRLHQRQPCFRLNMQFIASMLMEDSCHYLVYSMIFFYVAPFTCSVVLIPIFCFSLIHFASYSLRILDVLGPNSLWLARLLISLIELNARKILNLIAITEIMLMPFCVTLVFTGRASFLTPFMYHQFLVMRYKSQRNPSTRQKFAELRQSALFLANHQKTPAFLRQLIISGIDLVCWLGPTVV
ncbi:unnamed protein product [Nesidiocoris tenuis]|uniref:Uncharacterized protein n=2 Tax=Nesidiocoris tenuis TaxID=355587 RepID=A0ABN7AEI0_9HEMI|nr:Uncharacterised protein family (UPF0121) [Nesidiocoris tenuis]CAA9994862.1 unnamed protein product [Nesidiocoris tenuis]